MKRLPIILTVLVAVLFCSVTSYGQKKIDEEDYDKKIAEWTEAIKKNPKDANAYLNRGRAWQKKAYQETTQGFDDKSTESRNKAIEDYTETIRLNPKEAKAYQNRALARRTKGLEEIKVYHLYKSAIQNYNKAIEGYTKAIKLNPKNAMAYFERGWVWELLARADGRNIISIEEGFNRVRRADEYRDKALKDFTETIRLDPKNAGVYSIRASIWHDKNEYDKAIADYNEAIRLNSKDEVSYYTSLIYYNRAVAWKDKGDENKAREAYNKASKIDEELGKLEALDTIPPIVAKAEKTVEIATWPIIRKLFIGHRVQRYLKVRMVGEKVIINDVRLYKNSKPWVGNGLISYKDGGKIGYVDTEGKIIIPPMFDRGRKFSGGFAAVDVDGSYGYVKKDGTWLIKPKFKWAYRFQGGFASATENKLFGILNTKGEWHLNPQFKNLSHRYGGLLAERPNGEKGFFDPKRREFIRDGNLGDCYKPPKAEQATEIPNQNTGKRVRRHKAKRFQ